MREDEPAVADYTGELNRLCGEDRWTVAQGKGVNTLYLARLDYQIRRADGERARWLLRHAWLAKPCVNPQDEAWARVQGSDDTYWTDQEIKEIDADKPGVNLFEKFNLF
jgi:hypothetical protein